jgi:hypothetical protein
MTYLLLKMETPRMPVRGGAAFWGRSSPFYFRIAEAKKRFGVKGFGINKI